MKNRNSKKYKIGDTEYMDPQYRILEEGSYKILDLG